MNAVDWSELDHDGAQISLCPVHLEVGGFFGDPLLGHGLRAGAYRIRVRAGKDLNLDHTVAASDLPDLLNAMPAGLRAQAREQHRALSAPRAPLSFKGGKTLTFAKPRIMGVVNVTPDSFSDGGDHSDSERAIAHGRTLLAEGADILDIGGESTRPGAEPVWEGEEIDRILPVIIALVAEGATVSVDTRKASVMEAALQAGAHMINDVSALSYDPRSLGVVAGANVPVCLMHAQGDPRTMQESPSYDHVLMDVFDYLKSRRDAAIDGGVSADNIILDPGLGFGKRVVEDNMALLRGTAMFHGLGCPLLIGASRKRFIGAVTGIEDAKARTSGSVAAAQIALDRGAQFVRVHDVRQTREALAISQALIDSAVMDPGMLPGDI